MPPIRESMSDEIMHEEIETQQFEQLTQELVE